MTTLARRTPPAESTANARDGYFQRMALFRYHPTVLVRFPTTIGGVIHATGVTNGPTSPELAGAFAAEQAAVIRRVGDTPLSEIPSLAAWRRTFRGFGVDPTQYRSAAEALLRRLTKQGQIPSISTLVDLANLVSIRHGLPVAVFDLAAIGGCVTVCFARGDETWSDLGQSETDRPDPGEVVFANDADVVVARRWCWRQSAASAARDGSTDVLVTVEAHHVGAATDVRAALADLERLLRDHADPVSIETAILGATLPAFE